MKQWFVCEILFNLLKVWKSLKLRKKLQGTCKMGLQEDFKKL